MRSESKSTSEDEQSNTDKDEQLRHKTTDVDERRRIAYLKHKEQIASTKPNLPTGNISNTTGDDKLHTNDQTVAKRFAVTEREEKRAVKTNTTPYAPVQNKIDGPDHFNDDFYSYTGAELVECLHMCGLKQFAIECSTHNLDGEFFRNFDLNELKNDPFSLNNIELLKVRKVIDDGWRPK